MRVFVVSFVGLIRAMIKGSASVGPNRFASYGGLARYGGPNCFAIAMLPGPGQIRRIGVIQTGFSNEINQMSVQAIRLCGMRDARLGSRLPV